MNSECAPHIFHFWKKKPKLLREELFLTATGKQVHQNINRCSKSLQWRPLRNEISNARESMNSWASPTLVKQKEAQQQWCPSSCKAWHLGRYTAVQNGCTDPKNVSWHPNSWLFLNLLYYEWAMKGARKAFTELFLEMDLQWKWGEQWQGHTNSYWKVNCESLQKKPTNQPTNKKAKKKTAKKQ